MGLQVIPALLLMVWLQSIRPAYAGVGIELPSLAACVSSTPADAQIGCLSDSVYMVSSWYRPACGDRGCVTCHLRSNRPPLDRRFTGELGVLFRRS